MHYLTASGIALTVLAFSAIPLVAQTQTWRPDLPGTTTGDIHRHEMDRLRLRSEANSNLARQQQLNTRLTIQELQSAREPTPVQPSYRPLRSLEEERAFRKSATQRRQRLSQDVGQIDNWLDRQTPDRRTD